MMNTTTLLWLPGLLCNDVLFKDVNSVLPEWITPHCAFLPTDSSMSALAKSVLAKAPDSFVLGGLSMGGILALELFRQAPERIMGLILLDTNAADEKAETTERRDALVRRAQLGEFESITPDLLMPLLIHPSRLGDRILTESISQMAIQVGQQAFMAHATALATRCDARPLLADIQVPTLVIVGQEDQLCPVQNHLLMAAQIPNASLRIIPQCGHLSTMERPMSVAKHINKWLTQNQATLGF